MVLSGWVGKIAPVSLATAEPRVDGSRPAGAARPPHLWQVDIVRLLAFCAVIWVHSLAFTQLPSDEAAAGAMMLLQFGREVFFALTGFVLVYSAIGRPLALGRFWSKRILYVAVPYVAWSAIYYLQSVAGPQQLHPSLSGFGWDLLYGGAKYHLYFLLVTLQLYVCFPLILKFARRTAHRALPVLAAVSAANLAWLSVLYYVGSPPGWPQWFFAHAYELLPTYSMYVLAGCYAAIHLDKMQALVRRRPRLLWHVAAVAAAGAVAVYAVQLPHEAPRQANAVLQPGMTLSCIAALIVVYMVGERWVASGKRNYRVIETLSDASFGVYLSHPLVLQLFLDHGLGNGHQSVPAPVATVLAFAGAAAGSTLISLVARRTPLSLPLTGRPLRPRGRTGKPRATPERRAAAPAPAPAPSWALVAAPVPASARWVVPQVQQRRD